MNLPMQAHPVQRAIATYSALQPAGESDGTAYFGAPTGGNGVVASQQGVEASFSWTDLIPIATTILGAL